jgi:hypothetical protein
MTKPSRERRTINDKFRKSLVTRRRTYITAGVNAPLPHVGIFPSGSSRLYRATARCRGFLSRPKHGRVAGDMRRQSNITPPTLEQMRQAAPWLRVHCRNNCMHRAPMAVTPHISRRGANARATKCGKCVMADSECRAGFSG